MPSNNSTPPTAAPPADPYQARDYWAGRLEALVAELAGAREALASLERRREIAGDCDDRPGLARLTAERATSVGRVDDAELMVEVARRRLADAEAAVQVSERAATIAKGRDLLEQAAAAAAEADQIAAKLVAKMAEINSAMVEANYLDCTRVTGQMVVIGLRRALQTHCHGLRGLPNETLTPRDRITFQQIVENWSNSTATIKAA
jgi:hypothetical protein